MALPVYRETARDAQTTVKAAPRGRALTPGEWLARALELARSSHLIYRSHYLGRDELGREAFTTPSKTEHGRVYVQHINPVAHRISCTCTAGQHGLPCSHAGAAYHHWRQIEASMTAAAQAAQRDYDEFARYLETRGY